jgi:NAD(P)-dependent dehydrogenase (short-subunit alcohol dehydrogenase family)
MTRRTVLVTGANSGIGLETARALASAGWHVLVASRNRDAGFFVLAAAIEMQVRGMEEPYLLQTHGESYRAYARRVGRFVPDIGCLR